MSQPRRPGDPLAVLYILSRHSPSQCQRPPTVASQLPHREPPLAVPGGNGWCPTSGTILAADGPFVHLAGARQKRASRWPAPTRWPRAPHTIWLEVPTRSGPPQTLKNGVLQTKGQHTPPRRAWRAHRGSNRINSAAGGVAAASRARLTTVGRVPATSSPRRGAAPKARARLVFSSRWAQQLVWLAARASAQMVGRCMGQGGGGQDRGGCGAIAPQ